MALLVSEPLLIEALDRRLSCCVGTRICWSVCSLEMATAFLVLFPVGFLALLAAVDDLVALCASSESLVVREVARLLAASPKVAGIELGFPMLGCQCAVGLLWRNAPCVPLVCNCFKVFCRTQCAEVPWRAVILVAFESLFELGGAFGAEAAVKNGKSKTVYDGDFPAGRVRTSEPSATLSDRLHLYLLRRRSRCLASMVAPTLMARAPRMTM